METGVKHDARLDGVDMQPQVFAREHHSCDDVALLGRGKKCRKPYGTSDAELRPALCGN
jgi:hypothetical protein